MPLQWLLLLLLPQLAWVPFELDDVVRAAAPHVLAADWQGTSDNEMLLLQVRRQHAVHVGPHAEQLLTRIRR